MGIQKKTENGKTVYYAWYYSDKKKFTSLSAAKKYEDKMKAEYKKKNSSSSSSGSSKSSGSSSSGSSSSGSSSGGSSSSSKNLDVVMYLGIGSKQKKTTVRYGSDDYWAAVSDGYKVYSSSKDAVRDYNAKYGEPKPPKNTQPTNNDDDKKDNNSSNSSSGFTMEESRKLFPPGGSGNSRSTLVDPSNPSQSDRIYKGVQMTWREAVNYGNAGFPDDVQGWLDYYRSNGKTKPGGSGGSSGGGNSGGGNSGGGSYDDSTLRKTEAFKKLSEEDQQAVLAVFGAIAGNDKTQADRLAQAFTAASKINDPYFGQQLRLAVDAIERGYVAIDQEAQFEEEQIRNRLKDFREDFERKKQFMTLEQASVMKEIDREYSQNLEVLQNNLAASGFGSSSRKQKQVGLLDEATGDLRESKNRRFEFERETDDKNLLREERDTLREISRLERLTREQKLDFLRSGEQKVGTKNLPTLPGAPDPLGDIYGQIPSDKLQNTISAATSFVF